MKEGIPIDLNSLLTIVVKLSTVLYSVAYQQTGTGIPPRDGQ